MYPRLVCLLAAALAAACGGAQRRASRAGDDFACKDRRVEYVAIGGLVYAERGIRLTCQGDSPVVERYWIEASGAEKRTSGTIQASTWDDTWKEFDGAGWRFLEDCKNPAAQEKDPIYTFEISNGDLTRTFTCPGTELPFPYDRLRTALDRAGGELPEE